jgi:hypothetical protein
MGSINSIRIELCSHSAAAVASIDDPSHSSLVYPIVEGASHAHIKSISLVPAADPCRGAGLILKRSIGPTVPSRRKSNTHSEAAVVRVEEDDEGAGKRGQTNGEERECESDQ